MAIFNSYVSLPEGKDKTIHILMVDTCLYHEILMVC